MFKVILIGLGIGLSVSAPLGPTSVELIKRGLRSGFRGAFLLGLGAVTADLFYLVLVAVGVAPFLAAYRILRIAMWLASFVILGYLGASGIKGALKKQDFQSRLALGGPAARAATGAEVVERPGNHGAANNSYLFGIGIELSNPITIALWLSLGGGTLSALGGQPWWVIAGFIIGVATGGTFWFGFLAGLVSAGRRFVKPAVFRVITGLCSVVLLGFALRFACRALLELLAH